MTSSLVRSNGMTLEITGLPIGPFSADLARYEVELDPDFGESLPSRLLDRQTGEFIKGEQLREVLLTMAEVKIVNSMHYLLAEAHAMFSEIRDIVQESEGEIPVLDLSHYDARPEWDDAELDMETATLDEVIALGVDLSDDDWSDPRVTMTDAEVEQVESSRLSYGDY